MIEKGNMTDAEYITALISENKRLSAANTKLVTKNTKLETENSKLETANEKLSVEVECLKKDCHIYLEALILSKHKTFRRSSERTTDDGQQSFFNEAETEYIEKSEEAVSKTVKGYTRKNPKTRRDELIRNIETEIINCTIPDEEQVCTRCKSRMKVIGKKYIREEVELIPAKLVVKKYYSLTYGCKKCEKKNITVSVSSKRNVGDAGNDYIESIALKIGQECNSTLVWNFPSGAKLVMPCVINVSVSLNWIGYSQGSMRTMFSARFRMSVLR